MKSLRFMEDVGYLMWGITFFSSKVYVSVVFSTEGEVLMRFKMGIMKWIELNISRHIKHSAALKLENADDAKKSKLIDADLVKHLVYEFIEFAVDDKLHMEMITDKKTYSKDIRDLSKCFKHIISEIKTELLVDKLKRIFLERIKFSVTGDFYKFIQTDDKNIGYYVVPVDGDIHSTDVRNLILVKADPRLGYYEIANRTLKQLRERDSKFEAYFKNKYAQLNVVLTEDLIPLV